MKRFIFFMMILLMGCSNNELSSQYFDTEPKDYFVGESSTNEYDLILYSLSNQDRFYLETRSKADEKVLSRSYGDWKKSSGVLTLTGDEDSGSASFSGSDDKIYVTKSTLPNLASGEFERSDSLTLYTGVEEQDGYTYEFTLKLFDKEKTFPVSIVPRKEQKNKYLLNVVEKENGKVIDTEEFSGTWGIKERILFLRFDDSMMHFKTKRNTLTLISYENRYELDEIVLNKVK